MVCEVMKAPTVSPGVPAVPQVPAVLSNGRSPWGQVSPSIVQQRAYDVSRPIGHEAVVAAAVGVPSRDRIKAISTFEKSHQYAEVA